MQRIVVFLLIAGLFLQGCATIQLPELSVKPVDEYHLRTNYQGLIISIEPYLEEERVKELFGMNLLKKNIFPVLVVVKNSSSDTNFYLQKKSCSLGMLNVDANQQPADSPPVKLKDPIAEPIAMGASVGGLIAASSYAASTGGVSMAAGSGLTVTTATTAGYVAFGAAIVALPVVLSIVAKSSTDRQIINQNLLKSELREKTLSPGQSQHGFLFFQLPQEVSIKDVHIVQLTAVNLKTKENIAYTFPL